MAQALAPNHPLRLLLHAGRSKTAKEAKVRVKVRANANGEPKDLTTKVQHMQCLSVIGTVT